VWDIRHAGVENQHRVAVVSGDIKFEPVAFSADDSQFLQQRELSAREVARIFRVPAWAIDAPTGDSLTYANVAEQNRALSTLSLRPWATRIETAISNDPDLCPGGTYVENIRRDPAFLRLTGNTNGPVRRRLNCRAARSRRRTSSSSTTSGQDPSDPDSEPPRRRGQLRHISFALTAFLHAIGVSR
jgi:phage portal protein BeeE